MIIVNLLRNKRDGRVIVQEVSGLVPGQPVIIRLREVQDDGSTPGTAWIIGRMGTEHTIREVGLDG